MAVKGDPGYNSKESGVYILGGGGQKYGQITCWGKKSLKGDEKRGANAYLFPQFVKSLHIFSPTGLNFTKLQPKRLYIFRLRRAPPHYNKLNLGQKYEFKI